MQGGTTFRFVTDGIGDALDQARTAAGARDVAIAGGAATVNQYLAAGLIDELRTHIAPVTLGAGERSSRASRRCAWSSWPSGPRRSSPTSATASPTDSQQPALMRGQVT
jgi:dihydrofolate reductase